MNKIAITRMDRKLTAAQVRKRMRRGDAVRSASIDRAAMVRRSRLRLITAEPGPPLIDYAPRTGEFVGMGCGSFPWLGGGGK